MVAFITDGVETRDAHDHPVFVPADCSACVLTSTAQAVVVLAFTFVALSVHDQATLSVRLPGETRYALIPFAGLEK